MIKLTNRYRIILPICCFIWMILISVGCAHIGAQGKIFEEQTVPPSSTTPEKKGDHVSAVEGLKTYLEQTVQTSSALEKKGDLANAVEWLKVALVVDPNNSPVRKELDRLIVKSNQEAESHFKAGVDLRDSNPRRAKKEFLEALRIRSDYPEAVTALRGLQLESAEAVIHARTMKETKLAATGPQGKKTETAEDDLDKDEDVDKEEYSLDIAVSAFETGDYETAILEFGKIKVRYPSDPDIQLYLNRSWYNSGIAWFTKNDFQRALSSFTKVPKGFERVNEYIAKCRLALKVPVKDTVKPVQKKGEKVTPAQKKPK